MALLIVVSVQAPFALQTGGTNTGWQEGRVTPFVDPARLERAHERLVRVSGTLPENVSLAELLAQVLPSAADSTPATLPDDHRAALMAMAFYVTRWPIEILVQDARSWPRATPRRVTLGGRRDHAQHFIVSAAMAAAAGSALADGIALYKEFQDGQGSSGFSFSDVAANRAGQRFGTLASGSTTTAIALATRLQSPLTDRDIMPATTGLADNLSAEEFGRRYGSTSSDAYVQVMTDIDTRVNSLSLYR